MAVEWPGRAGRRSQLMPIFTLTRWLVWRSFPEGEEGRKRREARVLPEFVHWRNHRGVESPDIFCPGPALALDSPAQPLAPVQHACRSRAPNPLKMGGWMFH